LEWLKLLDELFRGNVFGKGQFLRLKEVMRVGNEFRLALTLEGSRFRWGRREDDVGVDLPLNRL
jgi:hypothetical protein